jgi:hypothetical protein
MNPRKLGLVIHMQKYKACELLVSLEVSGAQIAFAGPNPTIGNTANMVWFTV